MEKDSHYLKNLYKFSSTMQNCNNYINLHTGLFHKELENALLEKLKSSMKNDSLSPRVILIGSRMLEDHLTAKLLLRDLSFFNIRFVTFAELFSDLNSTISTEEYSRMAAVGLNWLAAYKAINGVPSNHPFSKAQDKTGFLNRFARTLEELELSGIDEHLSKSFPSTTENLKLRAIRESYREYQSIIKEFGAGNKNSIPEKVSLKFRKHYDCAELIVYGFYDFTPPQFNLIESLSRDLDIEVFLPYVESPDDFPNAFKYAQAAYKSVLNLHGVTKHKLLPECCSQAGLGTKLFHNNPVEDRSCYLPTGKKLTVTRAENIKNEVRHIVRQINQLCLWQGFSYDHIGILLWNPDEMLISLREELEKAGIPFDDRIGDRFEKNPIFKLIRDLIRLSKHTLKRIDVLDLVAAHEFNSKNYNSEFHYNLTYWEQLSLELGIIEGDWETWEKAFNSLQERTDKSMSESKLISLNSFRNFIECLFDSFIRIPETGSIIEIASNTIRLLQRFAPASDELESAISMLEDMKTLKGVMPEIRREVFFNLFNSELSRKRKRVKSANGVLIYDKMIGRGVSFEILFLPGLTQDSIPVKPSENPILTDRLRELIIPNRDDNVLSPLPLSHRQKDEERLLFALAVDSAQKHLYLSWAQNKTENNKTCYPSGFLLEICSVASGRFISTDTITKLPFFVETDEFSSEKTKIEEISLSQEDYTSIWLKVNAPEPQRFDLIKSIFTRRSVSFSRCIEIFENRHNAKAGFSKEGIVGKELVQQYNEKIQERGYPVTGLEDYATCPFRFWAGRIMKMEKVEIPEDMFDIPSNILGSLVHKVLEKFFVKNSSDCAELKKNDVAKIVRELLTTEINRIKIFMLFSESVRSALLDVLENRIAKYLIEDISAMEGFSFFDAEQYVKLDFNLSDETEPRFVRLRGKIDRVDVSDDKKSIRIIDYKTGKIPGPKVLLAGGAKIQLPLYLMAKQGSIPGNSIDSSSAEYRQITGSGRLKNKVFSGEQVDGLSADLTNVLGIVIRGIRNGEFPPFFDKVTCGYCDFSMICHSNCRIKLGGSSNIPELKELDMLRRIK